MNQLKNNLSKYARWNVIETELAIRTSRIPIAVTGKKKREIIGVLNGIKEYLLSKGFEQEKISFLDDEISRYEYTFKIKEYKELDDYVDPELVKKYAAQDPDFEGIIRIRQAFNYEQTKKITKKVYELVESIQFYISSELTLNGKIVAEIFENKQDIPVATLVQSKKTNKETGFPEAIKIFLFGERFMKTEWIEIRQVNIPFHVYRFITDKKQEFTLLSYDPLKIGDYILEGVSTQVDDYKAISDSCKIPTKLPYLFVSKAHNKIVRFSSPDEFRAKLGELKVSYEWLDFPMSLGDGSNGYYIKAKHPKWFKWLVWSWLVHKKIGLTNKYPFHIFILAAPNSGKSFLLNALHRRSKEYGSPFSGSSSTLKDLVPSFKHIPVKIGYLAESNRFAFMDEFLRCLLRNHKNENMMNEDVAIMNDLLEHQERRAGSGVSRVNVNMSARIISATNPIRGVNNMEDALNKYDRSFLSRWLVYWQNEDHINMIRNSDDSSLGKVNVNVGTDDFISLVDYLQSRTAFFDEKKVLKIYDDIKPVLSGNLADFYSCRQRHHLFCLMDGLVKARCLFQHIPEFKANDKDYEMLSVIWSQIVRSWGIGCDIKGLPVGKRVSFLPETAQDLYRLICDVKKPLSRDDVRDLVRDCLTKGEYMNGMILLLDNGLLVSDGDGIIRPYWFGINEEDEDNGEK